MDELTGIDKNPLQGIVSVTPRENEDFNTLCARLANYNAERFDAVALRFFTGEESIITIYAADRFRESAPDPDHILVHKFKVECSLIDFFKELRQLNFTISNKKYDMCDMEVINK